MTRYTHAIACQSCADRGWVLNGRTEQACADCEAGTEVQRSLDHAQARGVPDRCDTIRLLVDELTHRWTDADEDTHAGLAVLVSVHGAPVHMDAKSGTSGKVTGSPMPCAPDVLGLMSDLTVGALEHEQNLRILLRLSRPRRSGSIRSLAAALDAIPDLWALAYEHHPDHWLITGGVGLRQGKPSHRPGAVERDLRSWHRQCRVLLGAERRWSRVPTTCSVCGEQALRQRPRDGSVVCTRCGEVWTESELGWLDDVSSRTTA